MLENLDYGGIYPLTIVPARYDGVYEGAVFLAFPLNPGNLPPGWDGDDVTCCNFWGEHQEAVGKVPSPNDAYKKLRSQIKVEK